jgi:hypothetical protein
MEVIKSAIDMQKWVDLGPEVNKSWGMDHFGG